AARRGAGAQAGGDRRSRRAARIGARAVSSQAGLRLPEHVAAAASRSLHSGGVGEVRRAGPAHQRGGREADQRRAGGAGRLDDDAQAGASGCVMIDLYYWPTSNGRKITIMLHEVELPYNIIPVNL